MPLQVAVVGAGAVAHLHAHALAADPRVELVDVADPSAERREALADRYGVRGRYATHTDLPAAERLDLVSLCTPPDLHREQTIAACAAGVHVLCEKSPALSLAELDDMQAAADGAGLALAIVFQQRTGTAAGHVKQLLDSGALGRPLLAQYQTLWLRPDDYYAVEWSGTWDGEGGGTTRGHGSHQMDLLAHLLGDWAEVDHLNGHRWASWRITPARGVSDEQVASWAFPDDDEQFRTRPARRRHRPASGLHDGPRGGVIPAPLFIDPGPRGRYRPDPRAPERRVVAVLHAASGTRRGARGRVGARLGPRRRRVAGRRPHVGVPGCGPGATDRAGPGRHTFWARRSCTSAGRSTCS